MRNLSIASILLFAACAAGPRVTTSGERDAANATLTAVSTAVVVGVAAGKVKPADAALVQAQVAALREKVAASATTPVTFSDLLDEVAAIAAAWLVKPK